VATLVLRRDGDAVRTTVVTAVNEAPRLQAEELAGLDAEWQVLPWATPVEQALPTGDRVGTDVPLEGCRTVAPELAAARASLVPAEVERLRSLGADAAGALTQACSQLRPTDTERHAAALTGAALLERGVDPVVLLVAGGDRLPVHRHPLPTGGPLGDAAMVVACGRRHGLIVSLTRFVGAPSADAFDRILEVDAAVNLATRPGRTVGEVFRDLQAAYVATASPRTSGPCTTRAARPATPRASPWATRRAPSGWWTRRSSRGTRARRASRARTPS
jgi:antitoxin VapB